MKPYFDSGFLFKLYRQEANSNAAQAIVTQYRPPLLVSRLNEVEMLHVARRKTWLLGPNGQPFLTLVQLDAGLALLKQDRSNGILRNFEVDYGELFDEALRLSELYGKNFPIKMVDLLHVAMMRFGFDVFVTADKQQHEFAKRVGFQCIFLPA